MIKKICFAFIILIAVNGCTRDDICPEDTPTTPRLIIVFKNAAISSESKEVPGLTIQTAEVNSEIVIDNQTTDSIAIPLNPGADITNYRFTRNSDTDSANSDFVDFSYNREDIYVNRACSFKSIFTNLNANLQDEGTANWIFNIEINALNNSVENENETHITILH